jgi:hypothetical protein
VFSLEAWAGAEDDAWAEDDASAEDEAGAEVEVGGVREVMSHQGSPVRRRDGVLPSKPYHGEVGQSGNR